MNRQLPRALFVLALLFTPTVAAQVNNNTARDREIAARFAPVFVQGVGDRRRGDLITRFDFDGDWRGDNNWSNGETAAHRLRAYVYYAVSETPTHLFVHYAVFHAQDYKGGATRGAILSQVIKEGVRRGGKYDPTGLSQGAVLAHENDMEGCLVVAQKNGGELERASVIHVETLAHDRFNSYAPADTSARRGFKTVRLEGQRPVLYVEPKGHGVYAHEAGDAQQTSSAALRYAYAGRAEDPEAQGGESKTTVGYDLVAIQDTLWTRARRSPNQTFGAKFDYGARAVQVSGAAGRVITRRVKLGELGAAFKGNVGAANAARPPWAWFDRDERGRPLGEWFFDPAAFVKRRLQAGDNFSAAYLHQPFLGVRRGAK